MNKASWNSAIVFYYNAKYLQYPGPDRFDHLHFVSNPITESRCAIHRNRYKICQNKVITVLDIVRVSLTFATSYQYQFRLLINKRVNKPKKINMKSSKIFIGIAILASAILFMGCPYNSTVPLSATGSKVSDNFMGTWEKSGEEGEKIEISRTSGNSFDINKSTSDGGSTIDYGHFTEIGGVTFLNVKEESVTTSYYFYKLQKDGEFKVTLISVTANIREVFENSDEMKKFFEANMKNSYFFEKDSEETYYKVQ